MNETENPNPDDPAKDQLSGPPTAEVPLSDGAQTVIGRFRLLEKIGEGGFGVVYVAEQKTPVRRRVALKIIKLGMDTRSVVARFEAERQALAMMDHPNIAKVFDAGATDTGRPYFVMELVRGIPITEYCDQNNLPPVQRLGLFIDVCHAIQHAHQKGVIHRDIKPSNILVTLHDGVPVPKVIDFGIAKATQGDLTDKTIYTQFQQFVGTPAYMSPEQAEMSALDVDTRSDIYSLGVLLYELLTGTTPFDAKELMQAGMDEMRRRIRETDPVRPSNRLSGMTGADSTSTAKRRGMEAPKLITLLRGDLDWVVMKCLEKDRTRRYETANGLAMDIQRHLNNEPITARPPSSSYRFWKLVRRNKLAFGAGVAVSAALLLGIIATSLGLSWALRERAAAENATGRAIASAQAAQASQLRAEANEKIAQTEAARSAQVAGAMKDMLSNVGPNVFKGLDTQLLRAVLDQTAQRLSTSLKGQPQVEADLRQILGKVYADLDDRPSAEAMFREALRLRKEALGEEAPAVAAAMAEYATALDLQNKRIEALAMARASLAMRRKLFGEENLAVADSLQTLGAILRRAGGRTRADVAEADTVLHAALALRRKLPGATPTDIANTLSTLGLFLGGVQGKGDEAVECFREALVLRQHASGDDDPSVASTLSHLGDALRLVGKQAEAERVLEQALALQIRLTGPDNRDVILTRYTLGSMLVTEGKFPQAQAQLQLAADYWMKRPNWEKDTNAISVVYFLGLALEAQGKLSDGDAEALYRQTLTRLKPMVPIGDYSVTRALRSLATVLQREGKFDEACTVTHAYLDEARSKLNPSSPAILRFLNICTWSFYVSGRLPEALPLSGELLKTARAQPSSNGAEVLSALDTVASVDAAVGWMDQAMALFEEEVAGSKTVHGPNDPNTLHEMQSLAQTYQEAGRLTDSQRLLEETLRLYKAADISKNPDAAQALDKLGLTLICQGKWADAQPPLREALAIFANLPPDAYASYTRSLLGEALTGQKQFDQAEPLLLQGYSGMKEKENQIHGNRGRMLMDAAQRLVALYTAWNKPDSAAQWSATLDLIRNAAPTSAPRLEPTTAPQR